MKRFGALDERRKRRRKVTATINLVSLVDIFTIIVFVLLVNSSDGEVLPDSKVKLPDSVTQLKPRQTIVIIVSNEDIVVQGRRVVTVAQALGGGDIIEPLKTELAYLSNRPDSTGRPIEKTAVTILGERTIHYSLLKKIMMTCSSAHYSDISLAVNQKTKGAG